MFIHSVKTPRAIEVSFGLAPSSRANQISLLTGPNGSGKTDVLASIANVFHSRRAHNSTATIRWSSGSRFYKSTDSELRPEGLGEDDEYPRVRVIAQTFSPFSRFPSTRRIRAKYDSTIYPSANGEVEDYICIGFNQKSRIGLQKFSFSIIENALVHLSERPATARVAFEVLRELDFKDGIQLTYLPDEKFSAMLGIADEPNRLEHVLHSLLYQGMLDFGDLRFEGRILIRLRRELEINGISETAEYLRNAINLISEHKSGRRLFKRKVVDAYTYVAFKGREGMSSDFAYLQAFSVLSKLELVRVDSCELQPIAGEPIDLSRTSSGQQQMLCSIFGLAAALSDDCIVLIDEPEISLHPRWQMNFFRYLETTLEAVKGCHVIVATHSPLVAQAAAMHNVHILSMGTEFAEESPTQFSTEKSNSVEKMLVEVFDTPIPNSLHISKEIFGLITKAESGTTLDKLGSAERLRKYLSLYQRQGEGSREMISLLEKALQFVNGAAQAQG